MKLNEEQKKKVEKAIFALIKKPCQVCGSDKWSVNDVIFELREFNNGALILDDKQHIFPVIAANCSNCGNTILFNAIQLGLLEK